MSTKWEFSELFSQSESTTGGFTWPVRTIEGPMPYESFYQVKYLDPIEYWPPSIQIHTPTPMPDEEMIEKLRNSIQEYFGIQQLVPEIERMNIEKPQEALIPLRKGRIIERAE